MAQKDVESIVRTYFEVLPLRDRRPEQERLLDNDLIFHDPAVPGGAFHGREAFLEFNDGFVAAFDGLQVTIQDLFSSGDRAVARWKFEGTHNHDFLGIPATQRQVSVNMMEIFRISGGTVREVWLAPDTLGLLQQLGVIPPMGPQQEG